MIMAMMMVECGLYLKKMGLILISQLLKALLVAFVINLSWLNLLGRNSHNLPGICGSMNSRRNLDGSLTIMMLYDAILRKMASSRMTQLFQDVRKDLCVKPNWMGDAVFKEMNEHWESPQFKLKSEQNKKNRDANAGASGHTGGCIPHRVIWKRLKEASEKDFRILFSHSSKRER
ncbi:uncharacterized protein [Nicotiana tomentosiformis]|uniref:uncharacterized protein isoform X2 n=1 Tax=Nicotiana tomentosiformis TaxID=4098 RepID=UPI00051BB747|nr:uncharacterized protein LOC104113245 isoform X4 [Nicotiana tomentosiformis]